ncbi:hypothetical protein [Gymnodinialimonas hymeniacidonis]|uniref:hypothetical protein n=1 Tax=Gymnodinialimonas hymeniacidonis TaxID=3126508 RepID=UPI0034C5FFDB
MELPPLQMSLWSRSLFAERHRFLVNEIQTRFLPLLSEQQIVEEAEAVSAQEWDHWGAAPANETSDPSDAAEISIEKGVAHWELLNDLRKNTMLSLITGVFHNWDKELRSWLEWEVFRWCPSEVVKKAIWTSTVDEVLNLLKVYDFDVRKQDYFPRLDATRLVVNVYKHGLGKSYEELAKRYPKYLRSSLVFSDDETGELSASDQTAGSWQDHTALELHETDFEDFSSAIADFWHSFPDDLSFQEDAKVPKWFSKALTER